MTAAVFVIIILLHGLIHIMGFVKAYNLAEIKEIKQPVSKSWGLAWSISFLLFIAVIVQYISGNNYWWFTLGASVIISQVLIVKFWSDAKFGTIVNVFLTLVVIVNYAGFRFDSQVEDEIRNMFETGPASETTVVTDSSIMSLPEPVKLWLKNSGVIGKEKSQRVKLYQTGVMKRDPSDENWTDFTAVQYYRINQPAFIWKVNLRMMLLVDVTGRDRFVDGQGELLIKLFSLFTVAETSGNDKINVSTMQRFLSEIVWIPSAALSPFITWKTVNDSTAEAEMNYRGTKGSVKYYFSRIGDVKKISAERYMEGGAEALPRQWMVTVNQTGDKNGIRIPLDVEVSWNLEEGRWTWLKLKITNIEYNPQIYY